MKLHGSSDPRRGPIESGLVPTGFLSAADPDRLLRAVRAADVAGRWRDNHAFGELGRMFDVDVDALRLTAFAERSIEGLDAKEEDLPSWTIAVLNGDLPVPRELAAARDLLRRVLPVERWWAQHFNFRGGGERNQMGRANFTREQETAIRDQADELHLRRATGPHYREYDNTLVLGAGFRSPLLRSRYAAMWGADGVTLGNLWFLGSARPLFTDPARKLPPEYETTDEYAPGAADEFDLMMAAARSEFGFAHAGPRMLCGCPAADRLCLAWPHRWVPSVADAPFTHERAADLVDGRGQTRGTALSARTSRPGKRPNTADTLEQWVRHAAPAPGSRALVVTTPVFVPFQTFDCLDRIYLGHGIDVDVIGYSHDWGDRRDDAEYLMQETLSGLRSARRLLVAAIDPFVS